MSQKNHTDTERLWFLINHRAHVADTDCGLRVRKTCPLNRKTVWLGRRCADPLQAIDTAIEQAEHCATFAQDASERG